jgi:hypothetical protein
MIEAVSTSKTSASLCEITQWNIPEEAIFRLVARKINYPVLKWPERDAVYSLPVWVKKGKGGGVMSIFRARFIGVLFE